MMKNSIETWQVFDRIHVLKKNKRKKTCTPITIIDIYMADNHKMVALMHSDGTVTYMSYEGLKKYHRW